MKVAFLNRARAIEELRACADVLCRRDPRVRRVALFGSLARGDATPTSDADVLIVLSHHPLPRWFDRIPEYAEAFVGTALPVESFPFTRAEFVRLAQEGGWLARITREMITLAGSDED